MQKQSRTDKLKKLLTDRLKELEVQMLAPPDKLSDQKFEELKKEAIKLRDTLKMLQWIGDTYERRTEKILRCLHDQS